MYKKDDIVLSLMGRHYKILHTPAPEATRMNVVRVHKVSNGTWSEATKIRGKMSISKIAKIIQPEFIVPLSFLTQSHER